MGNTLWSKLNNKSKSRKSNYEISKKTNIPEEKVREVMNGERSLPSDRVDEFVNAIQEDNSVEKTFNKALITKWAQDTDLKALRFSFNYRTQRDLAKALGVDVASVCRIENKKLDSISDTLLLKYYDFFNDELNKKLPEKEKKTRLGRRRYSRGFKPGEEILETIDLEVASKWYDGFDIKSWLKENGMTTRTLTVALGYSPTSASMINKLINHTLDIKSTGRYVVVRLYAYVNNIYKANLSPIELQNEPNDKLVQEEVNEAERATETENTANYYQVIEDTPRNADEPTTEVYTTESAEEKVQLPNIGELLSTTVKQNVELRDENIKLKAELESLRLQVSRYEKLIDMIK